MEKEKQLYYGTNTYKDSLLEIILSDTLYLNSRVYASKDWRLKKDCLVFSNRQMHSNEITLDFDSVSSEDSTKILLFFIKRKFKFWMYRSGVKGVHVTFFTSHTDRNKKLFIARRIQSKLSIDIDLAPLSKQVIRAEGSKHPIKGYIKELMYSNVESNISTLFYYNYLSVNLNKKVLAVPLYSPENLKLKKESFEPLSIKHIKTTKFDDGHKRLVFVLASWWKSRDDSNEVIFGKIKSWLEFQEYWLSDGYLMSTIQTSTGMIRDNYRLKLLTNINSEIIYTPKKCIIEHQDI